MKKVVHFAVALTLAATPALYLGNNTAHAQTQALNAKQTAVVKDVELIFDAIGNYKNYYTVDSKGYHLTEDAKEVMPEKTYALLQDTFEQTNAIYEEKGSRSIGSKVRGADDSAIGDGIIKPMANEGYTYYADDKDTYYYEGPNSSVGNYLYVSDDDTRWLVNVLITVGSASTLASLILGLFPPTKGLSISAGIISALLGAGSAYISNINKGYGIVIRWYSGGTTIKARTY